jgi:2-C-methyl-D-erythritol 4-phosphate cytidylyltransferase
MKNIAIIMAAGKGKRFGHNLPKQYLKFKGREIIAWAIDNFEKSKIIDGIVIVVQRQFIEFVNKSIVKKYNFRKIIDIIEGGKERYNSVYNAIEFLKNYNPLNIFIHDAARPFFDKRLINKIIKELKKYPAVIPVKKINFTIKKVRGDFIIKTIDRENLRTSHTPQGFKYREILKIYDKKNIAKYKPTDEAVLFEKIGKKVKIIEDEGINIKITTKEDLKLLKRIF